MTGKIKDLNFFLKQIQDDIDNIKEEYSYLNENILKVNMRLIIGF